MTYLCPDCGQKNPCFQPLQNPIKSKRDKQQNIKKWGKYMCRGGHIKGKKGNKQKKVKTVLNSNKAREHFIC